MVFKRRKNAEAVEGAGTAASSKSSYAKDEKGDSGICSPLNWLLFIIVCVLGATSVINPSEDTPKIRSEAATVVQKVEIEEPPAPTWITGTFSNIELAALDAAVAGQTNIALNKGTAQIGSYKNNANTFGPQNAVDGKRDESTTTHTNGECDPWWQVDLAGSFNVQSVAIKNRAPFERLYNVIVEVLNLNGEAWETVAHAQLEENPAGWVHAVYEKPAKGTVVRIRLETCECLHMMAVEVYGTPA